MLRFFRQIRKKLIKEDNVRKYIWYALGEILLVMVGILLALQVNNWNEQRKAESEERVILISLNDDLKIAISESKEMILRDSLGVVIMRDFLLGNDLNKYADNQLTVDSMITVAIWGVGQSTPVIQTYNDIKSSGKTVLIQNEDIRNKFAFLEYTANAIRNNLDDKMIVQQFQVDEIVAKYLDMVTYMERVDTGANYLKMNSDYDSILENKEFRNTIASKQLLSRGLYADRVVFNELLVELSELIEKELQR